MKFPKIILICCMLITATVVSGSSKTVIHAENNSPIRIIEVKNNEVIPQQKLIGTELEGKQIQFINGRLYIDGRSIIGGIAVFIASTLAAYLINGVLIYVTGYSGEQLVAKGLQAVEDLSKRNASVTAAYFNSAKSTKVNSYKTQSGQHCVLNYSGTYVCAYSMED